MRVSPAGPVLLICGLTMGSLVACGGHPPDEPFVFVDHPVDADLSFERSLLRSLGDHEEVAAPVTMKTATAITDTRRSLISLVPGRLTYRVSVPEEALLTFSLAAYATGHSDPAPIRFRLFAGTGGREETIFDETATFARRDRWVDREVDLAKWSGRTIRLSFDAEPAGEDAPPADGGDRTLALWGNPVLTNRSWKSEGPNLVLISVDCLRADHVGAYGYERDTTPNIDALAADGVVFEAATSTTSWTLPSHVSMLTGLTPSFHGVVDRWRKISSSLPYLPTLLSRSGFETNAIVAWALVSQAFGFERGFESYRTLNERPAESIVDEALEVLSRSRGRRQFLFMHLFDPHESYYPPERELWERFGPRPKDITDLLDRVEDRLPPSDPHELQQVVNLYDAEIFYMDRHLGRFFDGLRKLGLYDNSLIILTADHGEAFFEHGHWGHVVSLYEEVVRVPLIVKWPGNAKRGRVDRPASLIDIFPTMAAEAGIEAGATSGVDLRRLAEGDEEIPADRALVSEITWGPLGDHGPWPEVMKFSVRADDFKYLVTFEKPVRADALVGELLEEELFDLSVDASEKNNLLLSEDTARAQSLRRWLLAYLHDAKQRRTLSPQGGVELDESDLERLKSLGYIAR